MVTDPPSATIPPIVWYKSIQYRHLIPAAVDRRSASAWSYKHPRISYKYDNLNISMTHVDCKSKVRLVIRSFLHPYPKSGWHSGMRSCIMPGLPTDSVQELNIGTVHFILGSSVHQSDNHTLPLSYLQSFCRGSFSPETAATMVQHWTCSTLDMTSY